MLNLLKLFYNIIDDELSVCYYISLKVRVPIFSLFYNLYVFVLIFPTIKVYKRIPDQKQVPKHFFAVILFCFIKTALRFVFLPSKYLLYKIYSCVSNADGQAVAHGAEKNGESERSSAGQLLPATSGVVRQIFVPPIT